jgi:hypothetical protein
MLLKRAKFTLALLIRNISARIYQKIPFVTVLLIHRGYCSDRAESAIPLLFTTVT